MRAPLVQWPATMVIRPARMDDAEAICRIVNSYAERGLMLHLSLEQTYERLRNFLVAVAVAAEDDDVVAGCAALEMSWADLAEVRSLAVRSQYLRRGIGRRLVEAAKLDARRLGVRRLFALTYEVDFFRRCGFEVIEKDLLPSKVWSDCAACPKRDACDETAMIFQLEP